jgi:nucleoside-diphosphate-sugar epimerase
LSPTRDLNFVRDTCQGFIAIAQNDACIGEEINIASNFEISMQDTLQLIAKTMKKEVDFIQDENRLRPAKSEVFRLWGSNAKLLELTGFKPSYSLETGLQETVEWFLKSENLAKYKPGIYNV